MRVKAAMNSAATLKWAWVVAAEMGITLQQSEDYFKISFRERLNPAPSRCAKNIPLACVNHVFSP